MTNPVRSFPTYRRGPRAESTAAEWGKTFLAQSLIGILLALVWSMLGLQ